MSAIDGATGGVPPSSAPNGFESLTSQEFLEIIFTELANQDPLAPNDTNELINQIGTIRSIESNEALTQNLESILRSSEVASSSAFIGKVVSGRSTSGIQVDGVVGSVSVTREGPILNLLEGPRVPLSNVEEIVDPAALGLTG